MKITIITPSYNAEATIGRTMDSVAAQTLPPFEYLVIDGGSTDNTVALAKAHPAVTRVISERDRGIADAFNKGIALSSGDVIGIINADDWYEPHALALSAAAFSDPSVGVTHGILQYWDGTEKRECFHPRFETLGVEMTINHPTVLIRKSAYSSCGVFDLSYRYAMDYELVLRLKTRGVRFACIDAVVANMSLQGTSDKHWIAAYAEVARAKAELLGCPLTAWGYFALQVGRTTSRKLLQQLGMDGLVRLWRSRFSVMRKE
ncbi:MAG TPA: glycosyltransferase family 2 protein [Nitratidesulfovibrio sp.]|nr:glycosyltransferase family 2 protein [Nitratidesulfovibrio sp.]